MDGNELSWAQPIVQLVTAGGFGALVWYMIVKHIPAIEERHRSEREEWLVYIKKRDNQFDEMLRSNMELNNEVKNKIEQLLSLHD